MPDRLGGQPWIQQSVQEVTDRYAGRTPGATPLPWKKETVVTIQVPSSRGRGVTYDVEIRYTDSLDRPTHMACTCPAFTTYYRGQVCSHITLVRQALRESADESTSKEVTTRDR